jgi:hypothetical protein
MILLLACTADPTPLDSAPPALEFSELQARVHEDYGTLVTLSWTQTVEAEVTVQSRVEGEDWVDAPPQLVQGEGSRLVVGLPYDHQVELRLHSEELDSEPVAIRTDAHPSGLPLPELTVSEGGDPEGPWILGSICQAEGLWEGGIHWAFILDRQGRVVWARQTPAIAWTLYARQSRDGRSLLLDEGTFWAQWDDGEGSRVQRLRLDGTLEHTYATVGLQHSFDELPGGGLVYGAAELQDESIVVVDEQDRLETLWTCKDGTGTGAGWCFSNTVSYDEVGDRYLFSIPEASQVVEVDAAGQTVAIYGKEGYGFEPVESAFKWQHGTVFDQDGHLLVSTHANGVAETVVRAYAIDHEAQRLTQVYSFGEGLGLHAEYGGTVVRSDQGYLLQELGSGAVIREADPSGELVWQVEFEGPRQLGRAQPIRDLYSLVD